MKIWRMRIACWIPKINTHELKIRNNYCFSTATIVAQKRLDITFYVQYVTRTVCYTYSMLHVQYVTRTVCYTYSMLPAVFNIPSPAASEGNKSSSAVVTKLLDSRSIIGIST